MFNIDKMVTDLKKKKINIAVCIYVSLQVIFKYKL